MSKGSYTSLTAGLLARKGEAVPATTSFNGESIISAHPIRRPLASTAASPSASAWANTGFVLAQAENQEPHLDNPEAASQSSSQSDQDHHPAHTTSTVDSHPEDSQSEDNCEPCVPLASLATGEDSLGRRSSVTFRLDATRYLCLKMAAAKLARTNQDILTDALDMYLKSLADDALGDCTCLQQLIKGDPHVNHS